MAAVDLIRQNQRDTLDKITNKEVRLKIQEFNKEKADRKREQKAERNAKRLIVNMETGVEDAEHEARLPAWYKWRRGFSRQNADRCWTRCGRTALLVFIVIALVAVILGIIAWQNKQYLALAA